MKNKRKPSPMKGKKFSPEHLEERRKRKADREERWRLGREGAKAKVIYQNFMRESDWMTHVKKEEFIQFLKNAIESEEAIYDLLNASHARCLESFCKTKKLEDLDRSRELIKELIKRNSPQYVAKTVLRLFESKDIFFKPGEGWFSREYNYVHPDFSMYCRDN